MSLVEGLDLDLASIRSEIEARVKRDGIVRITVFVQLR